MRLGIEPEATTYHCINVIDEDVRRSQHRTGEKCRRSVLYVRANRLSLGIGTRNGLGLGLGCRVRSLKACTKGEHEREEGSGPECVDTCRREGTAERWGQRATNSGVPFVRLLPASRPL